MAPINVNRNIFPRLINIQDISFSNTINNALQKLYKLPQYLSNIQSSLPNDNIIKNIRLFGLSIARNTTL